MSNISQLITDVFTSNYHDKIQGNARLVGITEINTLCKTLRNYNIENIPHIPHESTQEFPTDITAFNDFFQPTDIVTQILNFAKGKLSLCGGAIIDCMKFSISAAYPRDYDLFFHDLTVDEADNLLIECVKFVTDLAEEEDQEIKYISSQGVLTIALEWDIKIQFIRRVYSSKDQILLGFDIPACQYGWNPFDGFFSTVSGAVAFALRAFPVDTTQRSLSYGFRLIKYLNKGFNILLPGIPINCTDKIIETPDGLLINSGTNKYSLVRRNPLENSYGYCAIESDYEGQNYMNWWYVANERYHNIMIESFDIDDLFNPSDDLIRTSLTGSPVFLPPSDRSLQNQKHEKKFLGDKWEDFAIAAYGQKDITKADEIWKERTEYYVVRVKEIVKFTSQKENAWRSHNPGGQNFGKFSPIIANPREWYGKCYNPVMAGISMEKFQALLDCRKNIDYMNTVPPEIYRIICRYWVAAEAEFCTNRLLDA